MEIVGFIFLIGLTAYACWIVFRMLGRSEDPIRLAVKWIVTVFAAYGLVQAARMGPFGLMVGIVLGLIVGVMWAPNLGGLISKPLESLYDGGNQEIEEAPLYSMAIAKRKRGDYAGAISEVRKQLDRFPTDFPGFVLLSEIEAEDLHDLESARKTIETLLEQQGHTPKNIAFAINRLADWELKLGKDPGAALATLERIVNTFPESELAQLALQRMAHLDPSGSPEPNRSARQIVVKEYDGNIGLREDATDLQTVVEDPSETSEKYVAHLITHPHDYETREKLAAIYADHYQRLDLATEQLQFLIEVPHQPAKQIVRWLNLLANFQVRLTSDVGLVRETLERIIATFPDSAAEQNARNRIAYLNREMKAKQKSQVVKLGSYEQNIGLKKGRPTE